MDITKYIKPPTQNVNVLQSKFHNTSSFNFEKMIKFFKARKDSETGMLATVKNSVANSRTSQLYISQILNRALKCKNTEIKI